MKPRRFASDTRASMRLGSAGLDMVGRIAPNWMWGAVGEQRQPPPVGQGRVASFTSRLRGGVGGQGWAVMKASFTAKEYRQLLELVHLGMWTVTGYQGEDIAAAKRYYALDQKLLEMATDAGCADFVETMDDGSLQPAPKLAEDERVREIQSE